MSNLYNRFEEFPRHHVTVTPSNSVDLFHEMLLMAGSDGTMVVVDAWNNPITYTVTAGTIIPIVAKRVNATGTTVTPIIGLY